MSGVVAQQRYNWMGHTGAETALVDTRFLRDGAVGTDNADYDRRQVVIQDVKDRLYLIKRDLDLIPEEELKSEEEARQQRREARREREEQEARERAEAERQRQEQAERQRQEQEAREREAAARQAEADAEQRKLSEEKARLADRWAALHDSDEDSDVEDEWNAIFSKVERSQEEIDSANENFAKGCRQVIQLRGAGYVSYLDGSEHPTVTALEDHNELYRNRTERSVRDTGVDMPDADDYSLEGLKKANEIRDEARKRLDAFRCTQDPTYAARLRRDEKDEDANPITEVPEGDADELTLRSALQDAKENADDKRKAYNTRAQECAKALTQAACNRATEPGEAQEEQRLFAEERAAFAKNKATRWESAVAAREGPIATAQDSDMYPTEDAPAAQTRAVAAPGSASSPTSSKPTPKTSSKPTPKSATSPVSSKPTPKAQDSDMYPTEDAPAAQTRAVAAPGSASSPTSSKPTPKTSSKPTPKSATSPVSSKPTPKAQDSDMYPTEDAPAAQTRAVAAPGSASSPTSSKPTPKTSSKPTPKSATSPVSSKPTPKAQESDMYPTEDAPAAQPRDVSTAKSVTSPASSSASEL